MLHIKHVSVVPYSAKQMFFLINDINSYTEFIPGCSIIKILKQNYGELIVEIIPITNGIIQSIVTHNFFIENKSIVISLIKGPFKYFYGRWQFMPISKNVSRVEYISHYAFQSIFVEKFFNYLFQEICENIITIFVSRANQVYGKLL